MGQTAQWALVYPNGRKWAEGRVESRPAADETETKGSGELPGNEGCGAPDLRDPCCPKTSAASFSTFRASTENGYLPRPKCTIRDDCVKVLPGFAKPRAGYAHDP